MRTALRPASSRSTSARCPVARAFFHRLLVTLCPLLHDLELLGSVLYGREEFLDRHGTGRLPRVFLAEQAIPEGHRLRDGRDLLDANVCLCVSISEAVKASELASGNARSRRHLTGGEDDVRAILFRELVLGEFEVLAEFVEDEEALFVRGEDGGHCR
jgi:hypothetical protein